MKQDRVIDPRGLVYGEEKPVLLEKTGAFVVVNRRFALRYRSNRGAELEVTAGMDMAVLGRRRLADEEALQALFNGPVGNPDHISALPCDFDRDGQLRLAYVGMYRLHLLAETANRAGIGIATVQGVSIDVQEFSRNLNPKAVLRRFRDADVLAPHRS